MAGPRDEKEAKKGAAALGAILDLYMTSGGNLKILPMEKKKPIKNVNISSNILINRKLTNYNWMFKMCEKHYERFDPQLTNYQFKLNIKQLMCGIWT